MLPKEQRRSSSHDKLQLLRSDTDSHAQSSTSILLDASKYIEELKHKIKDLVEDNNSCLRSITGDRMNQMGVTVQAQEKGFLVRVFSEKSYPDLLVSILRVFEDLGIDVLDARVSCIKPFRLEAVGREVKGRAEGIDSEVVREAMLQALKNCREGD
ncbi:unnamed protein product [Spirodela intermedia]|uniref:Plant bHLH transcription factor ACT-like domain-containing protein n=1 Tax=Spirodela intermedia TaxID=51605 RepID=A0A7I8JIM4_SPIIN|nr:unnamed protein product [Spirodela intermedia]CAA6669272.1 unnamed protein product [Spirodela intermedia]